MAALGSSTPNGHHPPRAPSIEGAPCRDNGSVTILAPDGTRTQLHGIYGEASFEVPEHQRGQVWGVMLYTSGLEMVNIPSLFSYTPDSVLVPEQLDGI